MKIFCVIIAITRDKCSDLSPGSETCIIYVLNNNDICGIHYNICTITSLFIFPALIIFLLIHLENTTG